MKKITKDPLDALGKRGGREVVIVVAVVVVVGGGGGGGGGVGVGVREAVIVV